MGGGWNGQAFSRLATEPGTFIPAQSQAETDTKTVTNRFGDRLPEPESRMKSGAGEGNRTLVMSLGSSGNAIIRRPRGVPLYQKPASG